MHQAILWAFIGTGFTFLMTVLGAGTVFFCRREMNSKIQGAFFGFAAGVMQAALVWSLLLPAIERAELLGNAGWIPAAGGFMLGCVFLMVIDFWHSSMHRTTLLIMAVTMHNIPEGMAVGLAFAIAMQQVNEPSLFATAVTLAIGIGIQNFPEGAAVSLPLRQTGMSRKKAFFLGSLSGAVELIFGVGITLLSAWITPFMPWMLSFAAGAMMYVVVKELIPQATQKEGKYIGILGVMIGFSIMMILDVAMGS